MQLQDRVALVTGGAHRVGRAITLELARAGANVIVNYFSSQTDADETVKMAQALGVDALAVPCNVADLDAVRAMHATVQKRFGRLDVLINSASLFEMTPFPILDTEDGDQFRSWHRVVDILINGTLYLSNTFAPLLLEQDNAAIINIVDNSIVKPWPNLTAHATGKSGLLGLTRQLALELAPTVRVNAVSPGPVLPPPNYPQENVDIVAQRTLLKRWGKPEDIGQAVRFLCEADYITGEVLHVDGGERYGPISGW